MSAEYTYVGNKLVLVKRVNEDELEVLEDTGQFRRGDILRDEDPKGVCDEQRD